MFTKFFMSECDHIQIKNKAAKEMNQVGKNVMLKNIELLQNVTVPSKLSLIK